MGGHHNQSPSISILIWTFCRTSTYGLKKAPRRLTILNRASSFVYIQVLLSFNVATHVYIERKVVHQIKLFGPNFIANNNDFSLLFKCVEKVLQSLKIDMSLNLVPYGSDSGSDDDESDQQSTVKSFTDPPAASSKSMPSASNRSKNLSYEFTSLGVTVDKKAKKINITIPSLEELDCDSDDEDDEIIKSNGKKITPAGFSSLLSYLPKPRNQPIKFSSSSVTKMIPYSLSRAKPDDSNILRTTTATDNKDSIPFSTPNVNILGPDSVSTIEDDNHLSTSFKRTADATENLGEPQPKKLAPVIDVNDPTYKKYIAQKFGEDIPDQAQVIDVNVTQYLKSDTEHLKSISMERPSQDAGPAPNSLARRKHQITYLAYQARQREVDLKNQAAANRLTKAQTRAKYGF
ncbi:uncharacterized protein LOC141857667 [Brevipalpus obovatus]|uniref:uncharacterized protein LOC141857667 n=1 Tax=Brevipalpus obovatus TaxID=246614 RepID=UPI003D9E54E1